MKDKLNKIYAADAGAGSGSAGGNAAIKVEYTLVDKLLEEMTEEIKNCLVHVRAAGFTVTSYQGSASGVVTQAIKAIINKISSLEKPLTSLQANFADIKASYKTTESEIEAAANKVLAELGGTTNGGGGGIGTNSNMTA